MYCLERNELYFLNIFPSNEVVMLCSVNLLYDIALNFINETIHMTEGRTLAIPGLQCDVAIIRDIGYVASKHYHRCITQLNAI